MSVNHYQGAVRQLPRAVPCQASSEASRTTQRHKPQQVPLVGQVEVEPGPRVGVQEMPGPAQAWLQPLRHGCRAAPRRGGLAPLLTAPSQQPGPLPRSPAAGSALCTELVLAMRSGLPGSFLLPGDFSAVRSYDCSLKGRAFLAEGDIKLSLYKQ